MARASTIAARCVNKETGVTTTPDYRCFSDEHYHIPNPEWWITEDGYHFKVGDHVYNYYDCEWGTVVSVPDFDNHGWFHFKRDSDGSVTSLNSVRISMHEPRK